MALPTGCTELYRSRRRVRTRQASLNKVSVQQLFECLPAYTDAAEIAFGGSTDVGLWQQAQTKLTVEVSPRGGKTPGTDLITVCYEYWDLSAFPVGSATVTSISARATLNLRERTWCIDPNTGETLVFNGSPDKYGYTYKAVDGAMEEADTTTTFSINTGIPRANFSIAMIADIAGKINANAFLGLPANTVLCIGCQIPNALLVDAATVVVPLSYILSYNPKKWFKTVTYQTYRDVITFEPVHKYVDGVSVGYYAKDEVTFTSEVTNNTMYRAVQNRLPLLYANGTPITHEATVTSGDIGTFNFLQGLVTWWTPS
jgi:hypothetical protein